MNIEDQAQSTSSALALVQLLPLMKIGSGDPSVAVGIIDGPVDLSHPAFVGSSLRTLQSDRSAGCQDVRSAACSHGTAIAGILCAERSSPASAICPSCTFLLYPIFSEAVGAGEAASTSPEELAVAITETVDAGAKIINLSLGVISANTSAYRELDEACDYAARRGVILVAASGNQGQMGFLPLFNHPWIIPVASCDFTGRITADANISPTIGKRGLCAPGVNIITAAPGAQFTAISGTSAAAAIVTGGIALLWSETPATTATQIRAAVLESAGQPRRSVVPPLFNAEEARKYFATDPTDGEVNMAPERKEEIIGSTSAAPAAVISETVAARAPRAGGYPPKATVVEQVGSCPTCVSGLEESGEPPAFIYAIGDLQMRFPTAAIEKEFAQCVSRGETANLTDKTVLYNALKQYRYLANEACWVFLVEGVETYIIVPREPGVRDDLVEAVKPSQRGVDTDVIIGTRGPMAPLEMCNGLVVPIVILDTIYSFDRPELVNAIEKPKTLDMADEEFRSAAEELFDRVQQMADNVGASDTHRAINYLSVRYQQIYTHTTEMYGRGYSLTSVEVMPSRLTANRKLVNVIFSYTNRNTDVVEKYRVRVDVTEKYPYLDKKLSQYYERD